MITKILVLVHIVAVIATPKMNTGTTSYLLKQVRRVGETGEMVVMGVMQGSLVYLRYLEPQVWWLQITGYLHAVEQLD